MRDEDGIRVLLKLDEFEVFACSLDGDLGEPSVGEESGELSVKETGGVGTVASAGSSARDDDSSPWVVAKVAIVDGDEGLPMRVPNA